MANLESDGMQFYVVCNNWRHLVWLPQMHQPVTKPDTGTP